MASNLDIDQDLLKEAQEVGSMKTKKATVNQALKEFIDRRKQEEIFDLFGTIDYDPDYDYKKARR